MKRYCGQDSRINLAISMYCMKGEKFSQPFSTGSQGLSSFHRYAHEWFEPGIAVDNRLAIWLRTLSSAVRRAVFAQAVTN
jgi:hypothetical protein